MVRTKLTDPVGDLGRVLPGEALEAIKDLLSDPGSDHDAGELARIAQAFNDIGDTVKFHAKAIMMRRLEGGSGENAREVMSGTVFEYRRARTQVRVNSDAVKSEFPRAENPDLYKESNVSDSISISFTEVR